MILLKFFFYSGLFRSLHNARHHSICASSLFSTEHHACSSLLVLPSSLRVCRGVRGEGGFLYAPCCALVLKKAKAETCGSSKVKVFAFEEDCSLVNTDLTCSLSGRQVAIQHERFSWRSLQKALVCFWKLFAWENTHRSNPHCSPFSSSLLSHFPPPSAEPCQWHLSVPRFDFAVIHMTFAPACSGCATRLGRWF